MILLSFLGSLALMGAAGIAALRPVTTVAVPCGATYTLNTGTTWTAASWSGGPDMFPGQTATNDCAQVTFGRQVQLTGTNITLAGLTVQQTSSSGASSLVDIQSGSGITIVGNGIVSGFDSANRGRLLVSPGGSLAITSGAQSIGNFGNLEVVDGTLSTLNTGFLTVNSGGTFIVGNMFGMGSAGGTVVNTNSGINLMAGSISHLWKAQLDGTGTWTIGGVYPGPTALLHLGYPGPVSLNGTKLFARNSGNIQHSPGTQAGTLTLANGAELRAGSAGTIQLDGMTPAAIVSGAGTGQRVVVDSGGTLSKTMSGEMVIGVPVNNAGTYSANIAGDLRLTGGGTHTGTFNANTSGANVIFSGTHDLTAGSLAGIGGYENQGTFNWSGGTIGGFGPAFQNNGTMTIGGSPVTANARTIRNNGTIHWFAAPITLTNGAGIDNAAGGLIQSNGSGVASVSGTGLSVFNNAGTFRRAVVSSGQTSLETMTVTNSGSFDVQKGVVRVTGPYTQTSTGSLFVYIDGTAPGTGYSQLSIASNPTLAGALNVGLLTYSPVPGDSFLIMPVDSGTKTGDFTTRSYPPLSGASWSESFTASGLLLGVVASDLKVMKSASQSTVPTGGSVTFMIDVENLGTDTATNVVVTDTLPSGSTLGSGGASGFGWTCTGTTTISCHTSSLPVGVAPTIFIDVVAPSTPGTMSNTATVTSDLGDPSPSNNSSTVNVTVAAPTNSAVVTNLNDSGSGSLRAALDLAASGICVPCDITFNVPSPGVINLLEGLPIVETEVHIKGDTQPGYAGSPLIGVSGASCSFCDGLITLQGSGSSITGLAFFGFADGGAVWIEYGSGFLLENNWIGIDLTGAPAGNLAGVVLDTAGSSTIRNNRIEHNDYGIYLFDSSNNTISGNTVSGGLVGILVDFGDQNAITGNTISANTYGVIVFEGVGNTILQNSIFGNAFIGIDLGEDGPTANDAGDADIGANNLQNYPVIHSVVPGAGGDAYTISVDSSMTAAGSLRVQMFRADGAGQGQVFLGQQCFAGNTVTNATFTLASNLTGGSAVVATATSYSDSTCSVPMDGTSEFSPAFTVTCAPSAVAITAPASVCPGGSSSASATVIPGASYAWAVSNGTITSGQGTSVITFTAGTSGSVGLSLFVTNSCGATSSASASVSIGAGPPPTITASGPTTFCAGGSVTLTASTGVSYLWSNGATTQSITVTSSGTFSVTVTDSSGCSATSAPVTVNAQGTLVAQISGPTSVCPGGTARLSVIGSDVQSVVWSHGEVGASITVRPSVTTTYTATVTGSGGCSVTLSHTVSVRRQSAQVAITGPSSVVASSSGHTASVIGASAGGTFFWTISNGTITAGQGTGSITFTAGVSGPVVLAVTYDDGDGCPSSALLSIGVTQCPSAPPQLLSPAAGATGLTSPVTFSWSAVAGATGYEVWRVATGESPVLIGSVAAPGTSLSGDVPAGTFSWQVIALVPPGCSGGRLSSATRDITVSPGTNCPTTAPTLTAPPNGVSRFSPVTLSWTGVQGAIGYRVMASLGGLPATEIGSTAATATSLIAALPVGPVTWWVEALYPGCPGAPSEQRQFFVELEDCSKHEAATLLLPAAGAVPSSSVTFSWTEVDGADGYAVWVTLEEGPATVGNTVGARTLTAVIPPGDREWWVEAKFEGCPSTESDRRPISVPFAANCTTEVPQLLSPGSSVSSSPVAFSWTGVPGAVLYELWLSVAGGAHALVASTTGTTVNAEVPPGSIEWFVRARVNGCPNRDSAPRALQHTPPAACSTARPMLLLPLDDGRPITSPVNFAWTEVPGASSYRLFVVPTGAAPQLLATTSAPSARVSVPNGESSWYVEAQFANCPSRASSRSRFLVVPPPPRCGELSAPVLSIPGQVSAGTTFNVQWTAVPGADAYQLVEYIGSTAHTIEVEGQSAPFTYTNETTEAQTYVYRVRAVDRDCSPAVLGPLSAALGVSVLPSRTDESSALVGSQTTMRQVITIGPEFAGQSFTATPTQPWITVTPASGVVPAGGIDLLVTADATDLPLGTSAASVIITFGSPSGGRLAAHSNHTTTTTVSVNLVTPVTPTAKSAPPPDALIIPAVAHAQGVNAEFRSDVRVSNTSPQVMKYQLTFTPSGEAGMSQGRQSSMEIGPGRTVALDDVLRSWFGTGTESIVGTLEVRPLTQAGSSTSSAATRGVPNFVTFASSRTFNLTPNGTFGTYIAATPFANFVGRPAAGARTTLSLQQIAQSAVYRSNLGFVEGSGNPADLVVSVFNSSGTRIDSFPLSLRGGQHLQMGSFLAQRGIQLDDGRVEVQVVGGTGRVTAYASVVNNATGDSLVVSPVTLGQTLSNRYVLPGVAELSGGVPWQTDVRLFNSGEQPVTATLTLRSINDTAPQERTVDIAPGEVKQLDRILATLFGISNDGGALHITTAANSSLIATARTYRPAGESGNFGQFIQAVTPDQAIGLGSRPLQILQVEESPRLRSNVGLAEVSGRPAKVELNVIMPDARSSARLEVDLAAGQSRQLNSLLASMGLTEAHNVRVTVRVVSGEGRVTAYAATIDKITQDPTFIPAQ